MAATVPDFAKLVPGFDFLQGLVKNAGSVLPNIGQWVAPTLNPEELEKRIDELRTVQFWLEQNARMLGATIQALEVQRMTLSTLQSMNVPVAELRDAVKVKLPEEPAADKPANGAAKRSAPKKKASKADTASSGVVDPMQWWGALTQQFTTLATQAMKDAAGDSAKNLAAGLVKQGVSAAEKTLKAGVNAGINAGMAPARKAAEVAGTVARKAAQTKAKAAPRRRAGPR
ncbi:PhaM family polyhydroxyalkanoate granule multifunctional regulatory protein [Caldimonas sp. KR1-144]|uniref:PhaM family polyhydroxyalkanoate granule multifunctional regulatory protein n=1 Tax=Caldimonas sp. KR1-144 TaxID=3400911 RepID=UPI003C06E54D